MDRTIIIQGDVKEAEKKFYQLLDEFARDAGFRKIIYVCFNKPAKVAMEKLSAHTSLRNVLYIDMLSKIEGLFEPQANVIFLERPTDYNNLLDLLNQELEEGRCMVALDNLHSVFIFDSHERVLLFLKNFFNIISEKESNLITYLVRGSIGTEVEKSALSFADRIVETLRVSTWEEWKNMTLTDLFSLKSPLLFITYIVQLVVLSFIILVLIYLLWKM
jgi:hypothetical protein